MKKTEHNYAFIDTQNLNLSIKDLWRKLDRKKLRKHLLKKYGVQKVYLFIWYIASNQDLYSFFQDCWYHLIFKPVLELNGKTKGNVDAELVLQAMIDFNTYDKAVIITGDGDFACLIKHLYEKKKLLTLIVPNHKRYSVFLKRAAKDKIDSIANKKTKLEYQPPKKNKKKTKKEPHHS